MFVADGVGLVVFRHGLQSSIWFRSEHPRGANMGFASVRRAFCATDRKGSSLSGRGGLRMTIGNAQTPKADRGRDPSVFGFD
jgi:hypothetical protein